MPNKRFGAVLQSLITDSGLERKQICAEVERLYGASAKISPSDLSEYISGERMPRFNKFAALVDALGATPQEIATLVRSIPRSSGGKKAVTRSH